MACINTGSEINKMDNVSDNVQQESRQELINSEVNVFAEVETSLNIKIPECLKNLLMVNGFENEIVISNINDSDIRDIVSFARNNLHKIIDKEDLPKYYGVYWKNPAIFEILPGYRHTISLLSEYYKKKLSHKDTVEKMHRTKEKLTKGIKKRSQILRQLNSSQNQANTSTSFQLPSIISETGNEEIMDSNSSTSKESLESTLLEENARIRKTITSWVQGKVRKDKWEALKKPLDNISVRTNLDEDELHCVIKCFCGVKYNIYKYSKRGSKSKRWIYSNFQAHLLKKYIQNTVSSASKFVNEKNLITHYVSKTPPEFLNMEVIHNTEQDTEFMDRGSIEKSSQYINNEKDKAEALSIMQVINQAEIIRNIEETNQYINNEEEANVTQNVMNIMEVIDQAEIIFDTDNIIDTIDRVEDTVDTINENTIEGTVDDTENRIICSPQINKECNINIGCSISDSTCVIDSDIDSVIDSDIDSDIDSGTDPTFKVDAIQCDKWKSVKYQRCERSRRHREKLDPNQNLITDYFTLAEKNSKIMS